MVPGMGAEDAGAGADHTSPIGGLVTTFMVGAGAMRSTGLAAVALGLLIAALAVRGLGDRIGVPLTRRNAD
jgi:hypothetical protein